MEPGNVACSSLIDTNKQEIECMTEKYKKLCTPEILTDRALSIFESQKGIYGGMKIDMYEHGLQTATRYVTQYVEDYSLWQWRTQDFGGGGGQNF